MKYVTCRVHTAIVSGDIRVKHTYLTSIEPYSLAMSYHKAEALVFDTAEEIKPTIIKARNNRHDSFEAVDYANENWIVEPITEKELFVQRLT